MTLRDKLKFWILLSSYVEMIVRGTSPLSLPDAIADSLEYLKAFGGTEQRNLPDNYIERQFIYMMDGSYLLTDIVPTYDSKVEMDFQTTSIQSGATSYLGGRSDSYPAGLRLGTGGGNNRLVVTAFSDIAYTATTVVENNTRYKFTFNNKVATLESGGTTLFTNTFTGENANGAALCINGLNSAGTITANLEGIYLYSFKVWNAQGELVADYVPAVQKGTVPVVGFYDTVSGTFKTATAGTFAAGGEAVPTPDTPMDIVSNNGVLKARHQSGLPLGYTQVEYIESTGTQYIDTGIVPTNADNTKVKFRFALNDTTKGENQSIGSNSNLNMYAISSTLKFRANGIAIKDFDTDWHTVEMSKSSAGKETIFDGVTYTTPGTTEEPNNFYLFALKAGNNVYFGKHKLSYAEVYQSGTLVHNLIPCKRNSDNVLGMYDLVSGQFFTNQGTGDFVAGNAVSDPVEVYADGLQETIAIKDDQNATVSTATCEDLLSVDTYTDQQEVISGVVTRNVGVKVLDGTEDWETTAQSTVYRWLSPVSFSLPNLCICTHYVGENTPVSIANMPDMSIKAGSATVSYLYVKDSSFSNNLAGFKQYLADQYANGTPVIVIYPLDTPTTESVAGQALNVQQGDNIVEITQASLDNLELEAKFKKQA